MTKKGAAHIEIVLAFIIFTGSLFFLFYYLEPFSALRPNLINERITLEFLSDKLNTEVNIIDFVIYPDEITRLSIPIAPNPAQIDNADNLKITLEIPLDSPIESDYLWVNKTESSELIPARQTVSTSNMEVEIDWDRDRSGEETYRIYHSLIDSKSPPSPTFPSDYTDLKEIYQITSISNENYLSYKLVSDLAAPSTPYAEIRNALGIGSIKSINGYFRLSFPDTNTDLIQLNTQSKAPTPNADSPIYSASKNLIVYDQGKLYAGKLEVILW